MNICADWEAPEERQCRSLPHPDAKEPQGGMNWVANVMSPLGDNATRGHAAILTACQDMQPDPQLSEQNTSDESEEL